MSLSKIGTKITLSFPKVKTPNWICNKLIINPSDIIVVLDDDDFIHDIWDMKLNALLQKMPSVQLKHFKSGQDVINFIKPLPIKEKNKVLFLSDYELLNQNLNGFDVIDQVKLNKNQVILVTNYISHDVQEKVKQLGIKFIPKNLVNKIIINP